MAEMGLSNIVGIHYGNNEAGGRDFTSYRNQLQDCMQQLIDEKNKNLDSWTGEDEKLFQSVMTFAKKELSKMELNMGTLSKWTTVSGDAHKACELGNAKGILAALEAAKG